MPWHLFHMNDNLFERWMKRKKKGESSWGIIKCSVDFSTQKLSSKTSIFDLRSTKQSILLTEDYFYGKLSG